MPRQQRARQQPARQQRARHQRARHQWARFVSRLTGWLLRPSRDAGMATAEYAIATLAACGFAGLLVALMRSDEVRTLLYDVIRRALSLN
jgi:hypothetical protein